MIAVAFTVSCQRREYLERTLKSWSRARGIEKAAVVFSLEHYMSFRKGETQAAELEKQFEGFEHAMAHLFPAARVVRGSSHVGCLRNTRRALELGFQHADFVVLAEEDIEVSDDVLEYFTWASVKYAGDPDVMAVCGHSVRSDGSADQALRVPWFTPLVWGTWRSRWEGLIGPAWGPQPGYPQGWDYTMRKLVSNGVHCVYPAVSRAQHFGAKSTMTPSSPVTGTNYFHDRSQSSTFQLHQEPQEFTEVTDDGVILVYY